MVLDGLLIVASSMLFWAISPVRPRPLSGLQAASIGIVIAISFVWGMRWAGTYRVERYGRFWRPSADLLRACLPALAAAAMILWAFSVAAWEQPRWLEAWAALIFGTLLVGRQVVRLTLRIVDRRALLRRRVVVGTGPTSEEIAADVVVPLEKTGFRPQIAPPVGFIDAPILQVMHRPFKGSQGLIKMVEDYAVAIIALLLGWPIMLLAALALRLEGNGPILFRQARVGFNSKPFMMYKFRTMTVDRNDDGSLGPYRNIQRITPVGKFLRRTSIAALPQLINVLRGEMSVIGPRPQVANVLVGEAGYTDIVRQYAARHRIKPGITGWAQINGMRGSIDSLAKASRGADLDLYYTANWSLRLDLKILVRTIMAGLTGREMV
jgi:lipopolysaccharide/colanic/teichoic acid biosynthesis glycosyltransferase